jgi:hypothetical protein
MAPFGVDDKKTEYGTSLRPSTTPSEYTAKGMPAAGSSAWVGKTEGSITG